MIDLGPLCGLKDFRLGRRTFYTLSVRCHALITDYEAPWTPEGIVETIHLLGLVDGVYGEHVLSIGPLQLANYALSIIPAFSRTLSAPPSKENWMLVPRLYFTSRSYVQPAARIYHNPPYYPEMIDDELVALLPDSVAVYQPYSGDTFYFPDEAIWKRKNHDAASSEHVFTYLYRVSYFVARPATWAPPSNVWKFFQDNLQLLGVRVHLSTRWDSYYPTGIETFISKLMIEFSRIEELPDRIDIYGYLDSPDTEQLIGSMPLL